jgi:multidrug efflux system membrane fusion protein
MRVTGGEAMTEVLESQGNVRSRARSWCRRLVLPICALVLAGCGPSKNEYVPPPPPKATVAQPVQQSVTAYFELTGNTTAIKTVDLEARVQGFLTSLDYQDGAAVKKGVQLFGIQRDVYQAQLDQAQASLASSKAAQANAETEFQRQSTLMRQNVASQVALDNAKTSRDQAVAATLSAQANLAIATINLGYTSVAAPFDGTVTNHLVDVGALVGVSGPTKLATIVQTDPLYVYFNISETQVLQIKANLAREGRTPEDIDINRVPVEIGLQSEQGYPHKGHLDYVSPQVDSSTGTLLVRGLFDNKNQALLAGLFVRVRVPVSRPANQLLVLDTAIGTNQRGSYVLALGKDDVVEQKPVQTGQRQGVLRVIQAGLSADDWVVTEGIQFAVPGSKIAPEKATMAPKAGAQ